MNENLFFLKKILEENVWETLQHRRYKHRLITFYKMVNKQVPTYLQTLVPPSIDQISQRTLRSGNHLQVSQSRTVHYQNSFLPRTVSEWNALPNNIKSLPSLNSFKSFLNRNQSPIPSYYFIGERKYQVLHTRLRLGCSSLNADLFRNHVSAIDTCQCGQIETATHYLLLCPIYRNVRTTTIGTIIENINLDILLKGCPLYSEDVNISIFLKVQDFIRKSNRFWELYQCLFHCHVTSKSLDHTLEIRTHHSCSSSFLHHLLYVFF